MRSFSPLALAAVGFLTAAPAAAAPLDREQVRDAVQEAARLNLPDTVVQIEVHDLTVRSSLEVPPHTVIGLRVRAQGGEDWLGSVGLTIDVSAEGRVLRSVPVTAEITGMIEVPVLRNAVARGSALGPMDLAIARREVSTLPRGTIRDTRKLLGRTLRRDLSINQIVKESDLEVRVDAKRNRVVTLVLQTEALRILAPGILREDARIGDLVSVLATDTRRVVHGILRSPDLVEIPVARVSARLAPTLQTQRGRATNALVARSESPQEPVRSSP